MGLGRLIKQGAAALAPRSVMVHGPRNRLEVAVTFDDGPHPEQTPRVLEALAREGASATFFLQGDHAAAWPQCVRDIHAAGHQIANHSYQHIRARARSASEFVADVERTQALLQDIVGQQIARDIRPPYGDITPRTFAALARRGYRLVFWTTDSDDSSVRDPLGLVSHVASLRIGGGDIVLFHEDYAHTAQALPQVLASLRRTGLSMVRIDRLRGAAPATNRATTTAR
jgi:peptidoglycan/xylan/chitin deacetylase (PgdA/CDA1 family)